jgi:acyl carrier protein
MIDKTFFLARLEEILEIDKNSLTLDIELTNLKEWDSLAILGFISMVDEYFGLEVTTEDIVDCDTIDNLAMLINKKKLK